MISQQFRKAAFSDFQIRKIGVFDANDKRCCTLTSVILVMTVIIASVRDYTRGPFSCFIPNFISSAGIGEYITSQCWAVGFKALTYEGHHDDSIDQENIGYYQFVILIFLGQAIISFIPLLLWKVACRTITGTALDDIVGLSDQIVHIEDKKDKEDIIQLVSSRIALVISDLRRETNNAVVRKLQQRQSKFGFAGRRLGGGIRFLYMALKVFYISILFLQIFIMSKVLNRKWDFGYAILVDLLNGKDWTISNNFPRLGECIVHDVMAARSSMKSVAQCALPHNMIYEKIFIFLWCWFALMICLSIVNFALWLVRFLAPESKARFLGTFKRHCFQGSNTDVESNTDSNWNLFVDKYLMGDAVFIIRMIENCAGHYVSVLITKRLWKYYKENHLEQDVLDVETSQGITVAVIKEKGTNLRSVMV